MSHRLNRVRNVNLYTVSRKHCLHGRALVKVRVLSPEETFYDNLLKGYYAKEIVRAILDQAGYMVFPYGYESAFSYIKIQLHKGGIEDSPTVRRIRSSPDILVYDNEKKDVKLVEVKLRNYDQPDVMLDGLAQYHEYWPDSVIIVIAPFGHWFYAQFANKLKLRKEQTVDISEDFKILEEIFDKVDADYLYKYKETLAVFLKRPRSSIYFPEDPDSTLSHSSYNERLLNFVRENPELTFDKLFWAYNRGNLISRDLLQQNIDILIGEGKIKKKRRKYFV